MMEFPDYNAMLTERLLGRQLRADAIPDDYNGGPVWAFWGEDLGFTEDDIHATRAYRIWLDLDDYRVITAVFVQADGELLSPCCGYAQEPLDEFDYPVLLDFCLQRTEAEGKE